MQSFLQYKRFRSTVQAQLERDQNKAKRTPLNDNDWREKDLERGGSAPLEGSISHGRKRGADEQPPGVNPGEVHPDIGPPMPGEEEETMQAAHRPQEFEEEVEKGTPSDSPLEEEEEKEEVDDDHDLMAQTRLSRTSTQQTQATLRTKLGRALTGVDVRRRTTREGGEGDVFVVGFEGPHDPMNPKSWSMARRFGITFTVASIGCVVGLASAIDSSALMPASREFHVSEVVESLATGLFLVGFGVGALWAGPFSETLGRNPVYIVTLTLYMIFIMASALSPNIAAQLVFRFIAGCFASTPLTCAGGTLSDLWSPTERTFSFPIFANAAFTGPLLGPVIGGWIVQSSVLSWRWVEWITLIISGLVLSIVVLFLPETFPPILLKWKAEHLRTLTGDERYRSEIEIRSETFTHRLGRALYRPILLTIREPIVIMIALYLTVIYIVLFTFLEGYDYIFAQIHGTSPGITGLCFLGIIIGLFLSMLLVPLIFKWSKQELAKVQEQGRDKLPPEFRLWFSMLGGSVAIPISLFWMAWTSDPNISIWSPLAASVLFGYGILCVFITSYQYVIDSYEMYAASALASVTLIRYAASGGMTVVAIPFYENMGVHYTLTIMACLSCLLAPLPYVFYKYGPWIRSKSKYAIA